MRLEAELERRGQLGERSELLEKALQSARVELQKRDEAHHRREATLQHQLAASQQRKPSRGGRHQAEEELIARLGSQLDAKEEQV